MIIFPVETTGFPASMLNVYPRVAAVFSHPHVEEWFVSRKQLVFFWGFDRIQAAYAKVAAMPHKWCTKAWRTQQLSDVYGWWVKPSWHTIGNEHMYLSEPWPADLTWFCGVKRIQHGFLTEKMNYVEWWLNIHTLPIISNHVINESGKPASHFQLGIVISHPCLWDVHSSLAAVTRRRATGSPDDFMDFLSLKIGHILIKQSHKTSENDEDI